MVNYEDALMYAKWAVDNLKWINESECEECQEKWRANAIEYLRKALDNLLSDDSDKED